MKRKIVLGVLALLLVLQAQAVFAQDYNRQFAEKFAANDITGIEKLLKEHGRQMNLQVCLNVVGFNILMLRQGILSDGFFANTFGKPPLPFNRNRNSILQIIQLLVETGADVNGEDGGLYWRSDDGINYHSRYGSNWGSDVLHLSIKDNLNVPIVRYLLDVGADMYNRAEIPLRDETIAITRLFIEHGYNVNRIFAKGDYAGYSPLTLAAMEGQFAIVKLLVESGAKVNQQIFSSGTTAAKIAYEKKETDIYNYLKQNGATWSAPSQVATAPPASSRPRQTYDDDYDYSPPPSSSRSSSSSSSGRSTAQTIIDDINRAFKSPLQSGTYSLVGTQEKISLAAIAKSGVITQTWQGQTHRGTYNIDGNRMTVQIRGYTFVFNITSETSFSGHGGTWVRTGY